MKSNNDRSSHQSIGLDDDDEPSGGVDGRGTEPKRNRHLKGRKWENDRVARDSAASKMSATWTGIFCDKRETLKKMEEKREKRGTSFSCTCKGRGWSSSERGCGRGIG